MKIWTDRQGNKLTFSEFMERWKEGMKGVTPLQQVKWQISSTWIILIGELIGLVMCIISFKNLWWLGIILIGALFNTVVQLLGVWQKKTAFEQIVELRATMDKIEPIGDSDDIIISTDGREKQGMSNKSIHLSQEECLKQKGGYEQK